VTTVANDLGLFSQALPFDVGVGVTGLNLVGEHGLTVRAEAANQYALAGDDGQGPEVATVQTTYHVEAT
jgi:trehalose-6-phosphatase